MFKPTTENVANLALAVSLLRQAEEAMIAAGIPSSPNIARDIKNARRDADVNLSVWSDQV